VVAVTDLHEDDSKQYLQGLGVAGAKMVPWQGRGIALNRALSYISHNKDCTGWKVLRDSKAAMGVVIEPASF
jgi:hypothetical protein